MFAVETATRLDISAAPLRSVPTVPSLSWQGQIERSARRSGWGAAGSSSVVDPETAALVDCGTFHEPALSASSAVRPATSSLSLSHQQRDWLRPGLSESRRIARQRLAIRDSVKMSASAIRRFGDSVIPRIRGCQPDRAGPGRAQRRSYAAQATKATHLGATSRSNKFLSGLICIVKESPRKFESMRYLATCSGCSAASRLLRLCLSACDARQAAPLPACRLAHHIRIT